jgi:hypothetical protein
LERFKPEGFSPPAWPANRSKFTIEQNLAEGEFSVGHGSRCKTGGMRLSNSFPEIYGRDHSFKPLGTRLAQYITYVIDLVRNLREDIQIDSSVCTTLLPS